MNHQNLIKNKKSLIASLVIFPMISVSGFFYSAKTVLAETNQVSVSFTNSINAKVISNDDFIIRVSQQNAIGGFIPAVPVEYSPEDKINLVPGNEYQIELVTVLAEDCPGTEITAPGQGEPNSYLKQAIINLQSATGQEVK